jgi:hypothetical protein
MIDKHQKENKENLKQKWARRNYLIQGNTGGNTFSFLLLAFISYRKMTVIPIVHHPKVQVAIQLNRV